MSDTLASLRRQISRSRDLQSVVRTMKAMAVLNIGQCEQSVKALANYCWAVELGLGACFRQMRLATAEVGAERLTDAGACVVVFGSDQGLVGPFNDVVADVAVQALAAQPGRHQVWAVGERVHARLTDAGVTPVGLFNVPVSVKAITPFVGQLLLECLAREERGEARKLLLFYNSPRSWGVYAPVSQQLLPLDEAWRRKVTDCAWPTANLTEIVGGCASTLRPFIREYLFVSLFRACAESLASENASRLAAMERADKNIEEILDILQSTFHRLRQSGIDEELFDVVAGFEALAKRVRHEVTGAG